jgi:hypothetical protein
MKLHPYDIGANLLTAFLLFVTAAGSCFAQDLARDQLQLQAQITGTTGLLTGKSPHNFSVPSGWYLLAKENFESGSCAAGTWCGGNFSTTQHHNDGDSSHTHALGCQYGNRTGNCVGSGLNWNKHLPVGTREV